MHLYLSRAFSNTNKTNKWTNLSKTRGYMNKWKRKEWKHDHLKRWNLNSRLVCTWKIKCIIHTYMMKKGFGGLRVFIMWRSCAHHHYCPFPMTKHPSWTLRNLHFQTPALLMLWLAWDMLHSLRQTHPHLPPFYSPLQLKNKAKKPSQPTRPVNSSSIVLSTVSIASGCVCQSMPSSLSSCLPRKSSREKTANPGKKKVLCRWSEANILEKKKKISIDELIDFSFQLCRWRRRFQEMGFFLGFPRVSCQA